MKKIYLLSVSVLVMLIISTIFADKKENSASKAIASCELTKTGKKISVIKTENKLQLVISIGSGKNIKQNDSFIETQDARSNICPSEGFEDLSCSDSSFTIRQQVCTRQSTIQEIFTFVDGKDRNNVYLGLYKREIISKVAISKQMKVDIYSEQQIGKVKFKDVSRDYLTGLINKQ